MSISADAVPTTSYPVIGPSGTRYPTWKDVQNKIEEDKKRKEKEKEIKNGKH